MAFSQGIFFPALLIPTFQVIMYNLFPFHYFISENTISPIFLSSAEKRSWLGMFTEFRSVPFIGQKSFKNCYRGLSGSGLSFQNPAMFQPKQFTGQKRAEKKGWIAQETFGDMVRFLCNSISPVRVSIQRDRGHGEGMSIVVSFSVKGWWELTQLHHRG